MLVDEIRRILTFAFIVGNPLPKCDTFYPLTNLDKSRFCVKRYMKTGFTAKAKLKNKS